ncbi:MAG: post-COAP-1 domain-containing protein [Gaiellaceae bacterium]
MSVAALVVAAPAVASAATFTVTTADDVNDGSCTASHCSLREALNAANGAPGQDVVAFAIGGGGPQTIAPLSPLPEITDPVTLDASTQPGYAGSPLIEIVGTAAGGHGLVLRAAQSVIRGFVVNGFPLPFRAILLIDGGGSRIEGNFVGTDASGTAPAGNGIGIEVLNSDDNVIGGTTVAARNVVSGNADDAIRIVGDPFVGSIATGNVIQGNYIGVDASGATAVHNKSGVVVVIGAEGTLVGGTVSGAANVISGNDFGVLLQGADSVVQGNLIGTNAAGTAAVGNAVGIFVLSDLATGTGGSGELIGGAAAGAGNVISGNGNGIELQFASSNRIEGNLIGTDAGGFASLGNTQTGILLDRSNGNTVGGSASSEGNVIANTYPGRGVEVREGTRNAILGNSMYGNLMGIDLFPAGPTPNDPGDADTGSNELQNFPELGPVTTGGGTTTIDGHLSSHPVTTYRVELFVCDASHLGEGKKLLGVRDVTTDAAGDVAFSFTFGEEAAFVTSTATDPDGNTSEFTPCVDAQPVVQSAAVVLSPRTAINEVGTTHTVTASVSTVEATPHPLAGVTVLFGVEGSVTTTASCSSDATGDCSISYTGPSVPGSDLISAFPDRNGNGVQDDGEVGDTVTKVWVVSAGSTGQVTGGGQTSNFGGTDVLAFGFNAQSDGSTFKGQCNVEDRASGTTIKCRNVTSLLVSGSHATIRGNATINGVATTYRIEVDDLCESGGGCDRFSIQTASGYLAGGVLKKGNIQIHN